MRFIKTICPVALLLAMFALCACAAGSVSLDQDMTIKSDPDMGKKTGSIVVVKYSRSSEWLDATDSSNEHPDSIHAWVSGEGTSVVLGVLQDSLTDKKGSWTEEYKSFIPEMYESAVVEDLTTADGHDAIIYNLPRDEEGSPEQFQSIIDLTDNTYMQIQGYPKNTIAAVVSTVEVVSE